MDAIIKARGDAQSRGSIDVDVVLDFMDRVADNKAPVRAFYRKYGNMAGWIWLSEHTALYEALPALPENPQSSIFAAYLLRRKHRLLRSCKRGPISESKAASFVPTWR